MTRAASAVKNALLLVIYVGGTIITIIAPLFFFLLFKVHQARNHPGITVSLSQAILMVAIYGTLIVFPFSDTDDVIEKHCLSYKNYREEARDLFLGMNPIRVYLWVFPRLILLAGYAVYKAISARIPKIGLHAV